MIYTALTYIRDILNEHLKREFSIEESKVVLSNLVTADGSIGDHLEDKVVFFLINLEKDSIPHNLDRSHKAGDGSFAQTAPPLFLNMQLLFCTNFMGENYPEGLRYLSSILRFFQIHSHITFKDSPALARSIDKLNFEINTLNNDQIGHLWSALGSRLMPSIQYKVRGIFVEDAAIIGGVPSIEEPNPL